MFFLAWSCCFSNPSVPIFSSIFSFTYSSPRPDPCLFLFLVTCSVCVLLSTCCSSAVDLLGPNIY
ncbi:hypothetical protein F5880DRAFT_1324703 [Lentinula raphanica]|nr:hypothetical protein F5880DRAFT_1324703 [Lentinula raphanica]